MKQFSLVMVEVTGIQSFIFNTNNLKINMGASAIVQKITKEWLGECLTDLKLKHNLDKQSGIIAEKIEDNELDVEIIYLGGGNGLCLFKNEDAVPQFQKVLSRKVLCEATGLTMIIDHLSFDWEKDSLVQKVESLRAQMIQKKQTPLPNQPMPSLPVTATCSFSGEVATGTMPDEPSQLLSRSAKLRLNAFKEGSKVLSAPFELQSGQKFISEFDELAEKNVFSYMAVVHADGNGMGDRIRKLGEKYSAAAQNREYLEKLRAFSQNSYQAALVALQSCVACLEPDKNGVLPFRPVLFGGDDVTFICSGKLGLSLAHHYLTVYGKQKLADDGEDDFAVGRAGVAIVNTHYPFAQAYQLAADLADNAKSRLHGDEKGKVATIDWHFGVNGVTRSLNSIREHHYQSQAGNLSLRPLRLDEPTGSNLKYSWTLFNQAVVGLMQPYWKDRRNKLKQLIDVLPKGGDATESFLNYYQLTSSDNNKEGGLPDLPELNTPNVRKTGWSGDQCFYFDALEALDYYDPLENIGGR